VLVKVALPQKKKNNNNDDDDGNFGVTIFKIRIIEKMMLSVTRADNS